MDIYIVQKGDTVNSIAEKFGVDLDRLIENNGLLYPYQLLIGQALVIAYPKQTYVVQNGDSLESIAIAFDVSIMQLLRNNPFLTEREYIFPGETLVISYNTSRKINTMGFAYPFIDRKSLHRTLPELTYLSIINYTTIEKGDVIEYQNDREIILSAKRYGTVPLMLLTTLTPQGTPNLEVANEVLRNDDTQERNINVFVDIMKDKGYEGINIVFNYLNIENEAYYQSFVQKISKRLHQEGYLFFVTINYNEKIIDKVFSFDKIDYETMSKYTDEIIFIEFKWGSNFGPPAPVANINYMKALLDYVVSAVPPDEVVVGVPIIGYDWRLPYIPEKSSASSLSVYSVLGLAQEESAEIQFDNDSLTPYINYIQQSFEKTYQHIIWFIDARSILAVCE